MGVFVKACLCVQTLCKCHEFFYQEEVYDY